MRWGGKTWCYAHTHTHRTDTYLLFWLKVERLLAARQCLCSMDREGGKEGVSWGMGRRGGRGGEGLPYLRGCAEAHGVQVPLQAAL